MKKQLLYLLSGLAALGISVARADGTQSHKRQKQRQTQTQGESAPRKSLHDQFTGQQYGTAGCGLGSIVFADKPGMVQVVAATLNNIGVQTFAISSGTSNCGESGARSDQAALFIDVNKQALARDVARGNGEALTVFAKIVGCEPTQLGDGLRQNFDQIFSEVNGSSAETTRAIFNTIRSNAKLHQCSQLG